MPLTAQDPRVGIDIDQAAAEIVTGTSFPGDDDDNEEGADVTRETPLEAVPELVPDRVVRPDCVALAEEPPDPAWLSLELAVVPAAALPAVSVWYSSPLLLPPLEPESSVVVVPVELASCVLAGAGEVSPAVVVPASSLPPPPLPEEPVPEPDEATVAEGKTVMKLDVALTSWQSRS